MSDLYWLVLIPILAAVVAYFVPVRISRILAIVIQFILGYLAITRLIIVRQEGPHTEVIGGWPARIGIALRVEHFSINLVLTSIILFTVIYLYIWGKPYINRTFLFLFLVFQGLMQGVFLSTDLFNIFVLVELSTVVISALIMHKKDSASNYDGIIYLLTNIVAMSFFLFGVGLLYKMMGVLDLDSIHELADKLEKPGQLILPYAFLITGVSLKSALMPLFSWLPKAHGTPAAPSVVSAILSGLYVKSGVFLFYRIQSAFHPLINTRDLFLTIGIITAIVGFVLAIAQTDIKLMLAYSTVSQIGLVMIGMNCDHAYAQTGALYHIINHAIFKGTLFLTAGMIIEHYGTRRIENIRGLWRTRPALAAATLMAVLGIIGAPLFNGSMSKYWIGYGADKPWINVAFFVINLGTIVTFVKYSQMFWGRPGTALMGKSKPVGSRIRTVVVVFMGTLCLMEGVFSESVIQLLFQVTMPIEWPLYWQKSLVFGLSLGSGLVIYYGIIKRWSFFKRVKGLELSFNGICLTIIGFFVGILLVLQLTHS